MINLELSQLHKTWIFDLDGTIVEHNGYLIYGEDRLLPGVKSALSSIPENDYILILSARDAKYGEMTERYLKKENIRFNEIIYNTPVGERILINDCKPSGLKTAFAVNLERNAGFEINIKVNEEL
ncbi:MAG: hypothetical protein K5755_01070 [Clostridiales bacterium]|nr:hypothetical protein [Clostridiales bacterium]